MSDVIHGGLDDRELASLGRTRAEVVDLSASLHPYGPPAAVMRALREAEVDRYPSADASPLREALAALHRVAPECVVVTSGASAAIYLASAALIAPGDRCAVLGPTFGEYAPAVEAVGGGVAGSDEPADVAWLCNPNNPTGTYLDRPAVDAIRHRVRHLLIDAAYESLVEDRWDAIDLVREDAPVVVVHSLTKLFAIPGLRIGYAIAPASVAALLRRRQPPWPVGRADIAAGLAAIEVIEERMATVPALHDRRRRLERVFTDLDVAVTASRTNFVLAEVGDAPRFRSALLTRGFVVRDATSFGLPACVRIAVPAEAQMERLASAIREAYADVRGAR